jgi:hypothetical protein
VAAEDRRNRNEQIQEALDPLDLRPRIDRYAREGLVAGYLAGRDAGESLQAWLRRQPPGTLAAISKPEGSGEPRRGAPVEQVPVGSS